MLQDDVSRLRHSIFGCLNAAKLGSFALNSDMSGAEAEEFLAYIEQSADKMLVLMDQWDALTETAVGNA